MFATAPPKRHKMEPPKPDIMATTTAASIAAGDSPAITEIKARQAGLTAAFTRDGSMSDYHLLKEVKKELEEKMKEEADIKEARTAEGLEKIAQYKAILDHPCARTFGPNHHPCPRTYAPNQDVLKENEDKARKGEPFNLQNSCDFCSQLTKMGLLSRAQGHPRHINKLICPRALSDMDYEEGIAFLERLATGNSEVNPNWKEYFDRSTIFSAETQRRLWAEHDAADAARRAEEELQQGN